MATFQKRKKSWRVQVRRRGQAISATFDTKADAEFWAIQIEAQVLGSAVPEPMVDKSASKATCHLARRTIAHLGAYRQVRQ